MFNCQAENRERKIKNDGEVEIIDTYFHDFDGRRNRINITIVFILVTANIPREINSWLGNVLSIIFSRALVKVFDLGSQQNQKISMKKNEKSFHVKEFYS